MFGRQRQFALAELLHTVASVLLMQSASPVPRWLLDSFRQQVNLLSVVRGVKTMLHGIERPGEHKRRNGPSKIGKFGSHAL